MNQNLQLNPKIQAAAIAALLVCVVSILNAVVDAYPGEAWTTIVAALIPVIAGWAKTDTTRPGVSGEKTNGGTA